MMFSHFRVLIRGKKSNFLETEIVIRFPISASCGVIEGLTLLILIKPVKVNTLL